MITNLEETEGYKAQSTQLSDQAISLNSVPLGSDLTHHFIKPQKALRSHDQILKD